MGIISAINWLVTKDNGWLLFPWSGCNGHNLSSFCPARHSWLSIGGEHLVCSGNNLSSAVQWSNSWLCIDTIRHQSVAGPVQQEVTCGEKQIKASDYNSSYLVGFQSVSTEVFSSRSSQGQAGFHWVEPEIVAVIVFNQSSLLTPTIIVIAKPHFSSQQPLSGERQNELSQIIPWGNRQNTPLVGLGLIEIYFNKSRLADRP